MSVKNVSANFNTQHTSDKRQSNAQPVLQEYALTWCPTVYSTQIDADPGPPTWAIDSLSDGSVVANLQRQVAFVPQVPAGQAAPTTTCTAPATFTTAAYTNRFTLVPPAAAATPLNTYTVTGYACQGPLVWKMLPDVYDTLNGEVTDDGPGDGKATAAALRLQVPYVPTGVIGAGCAPTTFVTQAVTDFALLAGSPVKPTAAPTTAPTATATGAAPKPVASNHTIEAAGAAGAGVLLGVFIGVGILLHKRAKRRAAQAAAQPNIELGTPRRKDPSAETL